MPSMPHVEMTVAMLRDHGVTVETGTPDQWRVAPGPIAAHDWVGFQQAIDAPLRI